MKLNARILETLRAGLEELKLSPDHWAATFTKKEEEALHKEIEEAEQFLNEVEKEE